MIAITVVYVIATITICYFNAQAVNATKAQTLEIINQYQQTNRPYITICFEIIRAGLMCFVIENIGTQPAFNVNIMLNDSFIESVNHKKALLGLKSSNLYIAVKQKMFILIGPSTEFKTISANEAIFEISYCDNYQDHIEIDLKQYSQMLTYKSPVDEISYHLKKIQEDQKSYHNSTLGQNKNNTNQYINVVTHSASEDDSLKFKIYKIICIRHFITLKEIAEELKQDQETVHRLLVELCYVDNLVGTCINEDPTELNQDTEWLKK